MSNRSIFKMLWQNKKIKGFTLVEMITVLIIVSLTMIIGLSISPQVKNKFLEEQFLQNFEEKLNANVIYGKEQNKISYISFQRQKVIIKTGSKSDILYYPTTLRCYHEGDVKITASGITMPKTLILTFLQSKRNYAFIFQLSYG